MVLSMPGRLWKESQPGRERVCKANRITCREIKQLRPDLFSVERMSGVLMLCKGSILVTGGFCEVLVEIDRAIPSAKEQHED